MTARSEGAGHNYLIQHSAGSGKTNSISWLSHRLASLHTDTDDKVFDCVLVITDRRVLDRQLQDAIYQIEHAQGVVKAIDEDSKQLAQALADGTKIVITTLQKFPFVMRGLLSISGAGSPDEPSQHQQAQAEEWSQKIAGRRYAVIVDEAHSSQTGESAQRHEGDPRGAPAGSVGESSTDWEDGLNAVVESRGPQPNLSFFAFTATPKGKTVELFGRKGVDGKPEAFHVYSMRQAIEEGFILDVLRNYTDYDTYYKIAKQAADDPEYPERQAPPRLSASTRRSTPTTSARRQKSSSSISAPMSGTASAARRRRWWSHRPGSTPCATCGPSRSTSPRRDTTDVRPLVAFSGTVTDPDTDERLHRAGHEHRHR